MAGGFNLGSLIPDAVSDVAGAAKQTWQGLASDPVSNAAMLSAAMRYMANAGSPGTSPMSNFGEAVAGGMQAGGQVAAGQLEDQRHQEEIGNKKFEASANRASHEKMNERTSTSREEAAYIRGQFSVDRANISALKHADTNSILKYRTEARKILADRISALGLSEQEAAKIIDERADQMYRDDVERGRVQRPGAQGPVSSGSPSATSTSEVGTGGAGKTAAGGQSALTLIDKAISDPTYGAKFKELLSTPEGRQQLLKNSKLGNDVKAEITKKYPGESNFEKMQKSFQDLGGGDYR